MKYTWEAADVYAGRRFITNNDTEESIIGYDVDPAPKKFCFVSLIDGFIWAKDETAELAAERLNKSKHKPLTLGGRK